MFAANQQQLRWAFLTCPRCFASPLCATLRCACVKMRATSSPWRMFSSVFAFASFCFCGCPTLEIYYNSITCTYHIFLCQLPVASCQISIRLPRRLPLLDRPQHSTHGRALSGPGLALAWPGLVWPACKLAYRARNLANRRLHFASCFCGIRRRQRQRQRRIGIGIPSRSHATASDHCVGSCCLLHAAVASPFVRAAL